MNKEQFKQELKSRVQAFIDEGRSKDEIQSWVNRQWENWRAQNKEFKDGSTDADTEPRESALEAENEAQIENPSIPSHVAEIVSRWQTGEFLTAEKEAHDAWKNKEENWWELLPEQTEEEKLENLQETINQEVVEQYDEENQPILDDINEKVSTQLKEAAQGDERIQSAENRILDQIRTDALVMQKRLEREYDIANNPDAKDEMDAEFNEWFKTEFNKRLLADSEFNSAYEELHKGIYGQYEDQINKINDGKEKLLHSMYEDDVDTGLDRYFGRERRQAELAGVQNKFIRASSKVKEIQNNKYNYANEDEYNQDLNAAVADRALYSAAEIDLRRLNEYKTLASKEDEEIGFNVFGWQFKAAEEGIDAFVDDEGNLDLDKVMNNKTGALYELYKQAPNFAIAAAGNVFSKNPATAVAGGLSKLFLFQQMYNEYRFNGIREVLDHKHGAGQWGNKEYQEYLNSEEFAKIDPETKAWAAVTSQIDRWADRGLLYSFGTKALKRTGQLGPLRKFLNKTSNTILGRALKPATVVSGFVADVALEKHTEQIQDLIGKGLSEKVKSEFDKSTSDLINRWYFDRDSVPHDIRQEINKVGAVALLTAGLAKAPSTVVNTFKEGYLAFAKNHTPDESAIMLTESLAEIRKRVENEEITLEEGYEIAADLKSTYDTIKKLPDNLPEDKKDEVVDIIKERDAISERIKGKDPLLVNKEKEAIKALNNRLGVLMGVETGTDGKADDQKEATQPKPQPKPEPTPKPKPTAEQKQESKEKQEAVEGIRKAGEQIKEPGEEVKEPGEEIKEPGKQKSPGLDSAYFDRKNSVYPDTRIIDDWDDDEGSDIGESIIDPLKGISAKTYDLDGSLWDRSTDEEYMSKLKAVNKALKDVYEELGGNVKFTVKLGMKSAGTNYIEGSRTGFVNVIALKALSPEIIYHEGSHASRNLLRFTNKKLYDEADNLINDSLEGQAAKKWLSNYIKGSPQYKFIKSDRSEERIAFIVGKIRNNDVDFIKEFLENTPKQHKKGLRRIIQKIKDFFNNILGRKDTEQAFIENSEFYRKVVEGREFVKNNKLTDEAVSEVLGKEYARRINQTEELESKLKDKYGDNWRQIVRVDPMVLASISSPVEDDGSTLEQEEQKIKNIFKHHNLLTLAYQNATDLGDKIYFGKSGAEALELLRSLQGIIGRLGDLYKNADYETFLDVIATEFVRENYDKLFDGTWQYEFTNKEGVTSLHDVKPVHARNEAIQYIDALSQTAITNIDRTLANAKQNEIVKKLPEDFAIAQMERAKQKLLKEAKRHDEKAIQNKVKQLKIEAVNAWKKANDVVTPEVAKLKSAYLAAKNEKPSFIKLSDITQREMDIASRLAKSQEYGDKKFSEILEKAKEMAKEEDSLKEYREAHTRMSRRIKSLKGPSGKIKNKFQGIDLDEVGSAFIAGMNAPVDELTRVNAIKPAMEYVQTFHPLYPKDGIMHDLSEANIETILSDTHKIVSFLFDAFMGDIYKMELSPFAEIEGLEQNIIIPVDAARDLALMSAHTRLKFISLPQNEKLERWNGFKRGNDKFLTNATSRESIEANNPKENPDPYETVSMQEEVPVYYDEELTLKWNDFVHNGGNKTYDFNNNTYTREIERLRGELAQAKADNASALRIKGIEQEIRKNELTLDSFIRETKIAVQDMLIFSTKRFGEAGHTPSYIGHTRYLPGRFHTLNTKMTFQGPKIKQATIKFSENEQFKITELTPETLRNALISIGYTLGADHGVDNDTRALQYVEMNHDRIMNAYHNHTGYVDENGVHHPNELLVEHSGKELPLAWRAVMNYGEIYSLKKGEEFFGRKLSLVSEIDTKASGITTTTEMTNDIKTMGPANLDKSTPNALYPDEINHDDAYPWLAKAFKKRILAWASVPDSELNSDATRHAINKFITILQERLGQNEEDILGTEKAKRFQALKKLKNRARKGTAIITGEQEQELKGYYGQLKALDNKINAFVKTDEFKRAVAAFVLSPNFEIMMRAIFKNPFMTILYDVTKGSLGVSLGKNIFKEYEGVELLSEEQYKTFNDLHARYKADPKSLTVAERKKYNELYNIQALRSVATNEYFGGQLSEFVFKTFEDKMPQLNEYLKVIKEFREFHEDNYPDSFIIMEDPVDGFISTHEKWMAKTYSLKGYTSHNPSESVTTKYTQSGKLRDREKEDRAIASAGTHGGDKAKMAYVIRDTYNQGIPHKGNHDGFNHNALDRDKVLQSYNDSAEFLASSDYLKNIFLMNLPNHQKEALEFYHRIVPEGRKEEFMEKFESHSTGYGTASVNTKEHDTQWQKYVESGNGIRNYEQLIERKEEKIEDACKT